MVVTDGDVPSMVWLLERTTTGGWI